MKDELLALSVQDLRQKLLSSKNSDEIKDIVQLFNLQLRKKEIIRADVLSELQDQIAIQMQKRINTNADTFSNKDLLDYLNAIQAIINKYDKQDENKLPTIAIQNNVVVAENATALDKDSRDRVTDLIKSLLNSQTEENIVEQEIVGEQIIDDNET